MVKIWLYFSGLRNVLSGAPSWILSSSASTPPSRKNARTVYRYMIPIFLWSVVVIHDVHPPASGRASWLRICGRARLRRAVVVSVSVLVVMATGVGEASYGVWVVDSCLLISARCLAPSSRAVLMSAAWRSNQAWYSPNGTAR